MQFAQNCNPTCNFNYQCLVNIAISTLTDNFECHLGQNLRLKFYCELFDLGVITF